jgi:outer membrane protein assembly factor BamB
LSKRVFLTTVLVLLTIGSALADNWPAWRGPSLNGISSEKNLPLKWSAEENITWKLTMPSWTGATPIIWGERIFLNVAEGDDLYLWCVDRTKGALLWKKHLSAGNTKMRKQNMSSPSPVTDGQNVWVMTGTGILKAFDFTGAELWGAMLD